MLDMLAPTATLNKAVSHRYLDLPQKGQSIATYVWVDGTGQNVRSKNRRLEKEPKDIKELPVWNFDGSSTGQASGINSDTYIKPVAMYPDPFLGGLNKLVLCDAYDFEDKPVGTNSRATCLAVMEKAEESQPWFGMEQEYTLLDIDSKPLGWPKNGFPGPQGPYYCSVGADRAFGRDIVEAHFKACMFAGIKISGTNGEVMPGQWEYQVGPCLGIEMGDQLWMSRYILHRVAEDFGVIVTLDPKPIPGDWNGAGCHANYSTKLMRTPGQGMQAIEAAIGRLELCHEEHIRSYDASGGEDNRRRLTGQHETAHFAKFSWGVAHRGASVRVPRQTAAEGYGYLEDRRPASNCDPYIVSEMIVRTTLPHVNE